MRLISKILRMDLTDASYQWETDNMQLFPVINLSNCTQENGRLLSLVFGQNKWLPKGITHKLFCLVVWR